MNLVSKELEDLKDLKNPKEPAKQLTSKELEDSKKSLNNQYLSLAASLGDLEFKITQHQKEINKLIVAKESYLESINALNRLAAKLNNVNLIAHQSLQTSKDLK